MFTRLLNFECCAYILDNAYLSSGLYFSPLSGLYISRDGLLYIHSFILNG